jgi:hypothetical protein
MLKLDMIDCFLAAKEKPINKNLTKNMNNPK